MSDGVDDGRSGLGMCQLFSLLTIDNRRVRQIKGLQCRAEGGLECRFARVPSEWTWLRFRRERRG